MKKIIYIIYKFNHYITVTHVSCTHACEKKNYTYTFLHVCTRIHRYKNMNLRLYGRIHKNINKKGKTIKINIYYISHTYCFILITVTIITCIRELMHMCTYIYIYTHMELKTFKKLSRWR